jgi:O-acetyl-ADP-ribose deacetylase (regulator of RNase III)
MKPRMFQIKFVSKNLRWIQEIRRKFYDCPQILTIHDDIESCVRENTVFVSPANSYGTMNSGVDYVLSRRMFPGVEGHVKDKIASLGIHTALGRPFLPIGCAVFVNTGPTSGLIVTPTMVSPRSVADTNNAFISFLVALTMMKKYREKTQQESIFTTLVVTSHCCGYGEMEEKTSAFQMRSAYDDFMSGIYPYEVDMLDIPDVLVNSPAVEDEPEEETPPENIKVVDISFHARF